MCMFQWLQVVYMFVCTGLSVKWYPPCLSNGTLPYTHCYCTELNIQYKL